MRKVVKFQIVNRPPDPVRHSTSPSTSPTELTSQTNNLPPTIQLTPTPNANPVPYCPPVPQAVMPSAFLGLGSRKDCLRLRGLPYEAQVSHIVNFLGEYAANILQGGLHIIVDQVSLFFVRLIKLLWLENYSAVGGFLLRLYSYILPTQSCSFSILVICDNNLSLLARREKNCQEFFPSLMERSNSKVVFCHWCVGNKSFTARSDNWLSWFLILYHTIFRHEEFRVYVPGFMLRVRV